MCIVHCVITGVFVKVYQAYSSSELCEFILPLFERTCSGSGNGCLEIVVPESVKGDTAILKISLHIPVSLTNRERLTTTNAPISGIKDGDQVRKCEAIEEGKLLVGSNRQGSVQGEGHRQVQGSCA